MDEVLRRFETDKSTPDDNRAGLRSHGLKPGVPVHAREERRALLDPFADRPRVGYGPHVKNAGEVDAGQRWTDRRRARRQNELVVGLGRHLSGRDIAQVDGLRLGRDDGRLVARAHVDGELVSESVGVRDEEAGFLLDDPADMVGEPAVRV